MVNSEEYFRGRHTNSDNISRDTSNKHKPKVSEEAASLYEELLGKAHKDVVDTIEISNNTINLNAVLFRDPGELKLICNYTVILNGNELSGSVKVEDFNQDKQDLLREIVKEVSKKLAIDIVDMAISTAGEFNYLK